MRIKIVYTITIFICLAITSCISDFQLPEIDNDDDRIILQSFIHQDSIIEVKVNAFNNTNIEFDSLRIILIGNDIPLDTFQRNSENVFRSNRMVADFSAQDQIKLTVHRGNAMIFESRIFNFPVDPVISFSALTDTLLNNPAVVNFERKGELSFFNDGNVFKATRLELDVINFRNDTLVEHFFPQYFDGDNCSERIFYLRSYTSLDTECYSNQSIDVDYRLVNLNSQDTIINATFEICNISEDLAEYFDSQSKVFEGTDFFYSPFEPLNFNYENDNVLAIIGELNCKKFTTQF